MSELEFRTTILGSCRVYDPLRARHATAEQTGIPGFTHTTREHLQLMGAYGIAVPEDPLLLRMANLQGLSRLGLAEGSDNRSYVLEISSIRVLRYKGFYLQIHRFFEVMSELAGQAYNALSFKSEEALRDSLALLPALPLDPTDVFFYEQSEDEVYEDLLRIYRALGRRILLVCHFDADYQGRPIKQRSIIRKALQRMQFEHGVHCYDPTPAVSGWGMTQSVVDLGHYTPEFGAYLAKVLPARLRELELTYPPGSDLPLD